MSSTAHTLAVNFGCLLLASAIMYLFNRYVPRIERWLKHYFVYRHYPTEYQRVCVCGETFLMHEGDGGACTGGRCHCRKFVCVELEKQL